MTGYPIAHLSGNSLNELLVPNRTADWTKEPNEVAFLAHKHTKTH